MLIGVISDTHGLLRPEAVAALRGVEHILHAGDVGDVAILDALREIAPVMCLGLVRSCRLPMWSS
jgi:predicted phosphodiesterase